MTFGDMISFDKVATLGGWSTILKDAVTAALGSEATVGGKSGWPAMMAVSWCKDVRCFNLALVEVGTMCPSCLIRTATATMGRSYSEVTGTWQ